MDQIRHKIKQFFEAHIPIHYPEGRMIVPAGTEPTGIYFIDQGYVRQYDISARTGLELTIHIFKPGAYFPLVWAVSEKPNQYFFEAMTEVRGWRAAKEDVLQFIRQNPDVLYELTERLLLGLEGLTTRLDYLVFGDASTRVITELVYLAKHFGESSGNKIVIDHRFTHYNIAALTGMARETVSVAMGKLQKQGLIHYREHQIIINDLELLHRTLYEWLWGRK